MGYFFFVLSDFPSSRSSKFIPKHLIDECGGVAIPPSRGLCVVVRVTSFTSLHAFQALAPFPFFFFHSLYY